MKCPICGGPVEAIELDNGGRVADDCRNCKPRGYTQQHPDGPHMWDYADDNSLVRNVDHYEEGEDDE